MRTASPITAAFLVAYPLAVYFGLEHLGPRALGIVLLFGLVPLALGTRSAAVRTSLPLLWGAAGLIALLLGAAAWLERAGLMMLVPAVVNGVFLVSFGASLWLGPPMVERFARLQDPDLRPAEVSWCRTWTFIWSGFFALNITIISLLADPSRARWWTLYTGGLAYGLMGLLFASEFVLRKRRFGRLGTSRLDRLLARLFFDGKDTPR